MPSDRVSGNTRGALPKVNAAGWENTLVLNHAPSLSCVERSLGRFGSPPTLGLWRSENTFALLELFSITSGLPLWNVAMPFNCQPPSTAFSGPDQCDPRRCPGPKGRFAT